MKKRIWSILLALVILLSLVPFSASAADLSDLDYCIEDGSVTITGCDKSASGELVIPSHIEGYPVTSIGYSAFYSCTGLTSVTIPSSVMSIEAYAFLNCTSLTSVTIPSSVTSIGDRAFYGCSGLTSVTIPNSVRSIDSEAFSACTSLISINVANGNNKYSSSDGVLFNKDKTELICFPAGKTSGAYTIPSMVTCIGDCAFECCYSLTSVTIPSSVTSIGVASFYGCSSLTSISVPDSVVSIWGSAFYGCKSLTSVTIGDGVTYIGDYTFCGCTGLTSVMIPSSVKSFGEWSFSGCKSLKSVTIQSGETSIGEGSFSDCKSLKSVTIPPSVTHIGPSAFSGCTSLTSVTIPSSVTVIWYSAFNDCDELHDVYYNGTKEQWNEISILDENDDLLAATIHFNPSETPEVTPTPKPTPTPLEPSESPTTHRHEMLDHTYRFENLVSVVSTDIRDHVLGGVNAWWKLFDGVTNLRGTSGQCYGMAVSAAATAVFGSPSETSYKFGKKTAKMLYDITSGWTSLETKTTATNYIGYAFLYQTAPKRQLEKNLNKVEAGSINPLKTGNFEKFIQAVQSYERTKEHPVIIDFANHAVWALGIQSNTSKKVEVVIYDCNYPGKNRVLTFFKTAHGKFSHLEYSNFDKSKNEWVPFTRSEFSFETSAVEDFIDAWDHKFQGAYTDTLYDHLLVSTSRNIIIESDTGFQGTLDPESVEEYEDIIPISIEAESSGESSHDLYYVSGNSELHFMVPSTEKSAQVSFATQTDGIDITAQGNSTALISVPENGAMKADVQSAKSAPFSISYNQTTDLEQLQTITVSGSSSNVQTEQTEQGIEVRANDLQTVNIQLNTDGTELDSTTIQVTGDSLFISTKDDKVVVHESGQNPFKDVKKGAYYYDAVAWAVNHDPVVTTGTDATHFSPNKDCTRAQMVTFLWRAAGEPKPASTKNPFKDVKKGAYYYDAVLWAVGEGITTGTSKNTFSPDATVTRAQTVTFLWRMENEPAVKAKNPFKDVKKGQYYTDAVLWAVKNEITNGKTANTFAPSDPCTRAQIVTFLYRDMK